MSYLYTNYKGFAINTHSHSSGSTFNDCPTRWNYQKRKGWREKDTNAAPEFGKCFEEALQFYHECGFNLDRAIDELKRLWLFRKDEKLKYKDRENWDLFLAQGIELLRLYAVKLPVLPFAAPKFQLNYKKELFPGDENYSDIFDTGFVDMQIDAPPKGHLLLPKPNHPENGQPLLVDIKTSGKPYPTNAKLLRMDPQLRRYSWLSGIETVAFLVFVRSSLSLERGDEVTVLIEAAPFSKGQRAIVFESHEPEDDEHSAYIMTYGDYDEYLKEAKDVRGNALKAIKEDYINWRCSLIRREDIAKQQIQFLCTIITDEDRRQVGELVGREVVQIVDSDRNNDFPQKPGIRFPSSHCTFCPYLGLCIDDPNMVQSKLVNISNATVPVKDWLEDEE